MGFRSRLTSMLLARGGLFGLGLNPSVQQTANTGLIQNNGAGASTTPTGPFGYTRWGVDQLKSAMTQRWERRIAATREALYTQYGSQMTVGNWRFPSQNCYWQGKAGYQNMLDPIGIASIADVPFTPQQLLDSVTADQPLAITYAPSPDQQLHADFMIYVASQRQLATLLGGTLAATPDLYLDLVNPDRGIQALINRPRYGATLRANASINDVRSKAAFGWYIDGFGMNSIAPTDEERTQAGGLAKFYARGGFLISEMIANGHTPVSTEFIRVNTGYSLCASDPNKSGAINAPSNPVVATSKALSTDDNARWNIRIAVAPGSYTMRITPQEYGTGTKIKAAIGAVMKQLFEIICMSQPVLQEQANTVLLAELCVDSAMRACKKGAPGCTCTGPTTGQQAAVKMGSAIAAYSCGHATTPGASMDPGFVPPVFQPPAEDVSKIPWWLVVGGGLIAGAALFARK
jgi:hypothetical protein